MTGESSLYLPSVPFPWSLAVHQQSLLYFAKNEAPEEEAGKIEEKQNEKKSLAV